MEIESVTSRQWNKLTDTCELSSIYLDSRWLELIEAVYPRLKVWRLVCMNSSRQPLWLLPLVEIRPLGRLKPMLISLPFGNYGGFLFPGGTSAVMNEETLEPLNRFFSNSRAFAMEIRLIEAPISVFQTDDKFKRFEIVFPDNIEIMWKKVITGNARTSVRKANKLGVNIIFDYVNALNVFQSIYERHASFHGTPIHHLNWFKHMASRFCDDMEIVLAQFNGRFVGAQLYLYHQDTAILQSSVTDPAFNNIPVTDKMLWGSFEKIMGKGHITRFDFGRTRPDPGKLFFKRKWGGKERPIYYSYFIKEGHTIPNILPENQKLKPAIQLWRLLPLCITRLWGPFLRMRIPT